MRQLRWVHDRLEQLYGPRTWTPERESILDGLVATILSQNTTDVNSTRAFAELKRRFPTWDAARTARATSIEAAIRSGGLARTKARRIKAILRQIHAEHGATSLEHLRRRPSPAVHEALGRLVGVGPKTVSCVLLFTMGRPDFPVDTHVHRIARRLGWIVEGTTAEATYAALNAVVPDALAYSLHVLMVHHGRTLCRARAPTCDDCPLAPRCPAAATAGRGPT